MGPSVGPACSEPPSAAHHSTRPYHFNPPRTDRTTSVDVGQGWLFTEKGMESWPSAALVTLLGVDLGWTWGPPLMPPFPTSLTPRLGARHGGCVVAEGVAVDRPGVVAREPGPRGTRTVAHCVESHCPVSWFEKRWDTKILVPRGLLHNGSVKRPVGAR